MKLILKFSKNIQVLPFDYVKYLNRYLHTILGENNKYHDSLSLYSTSFLHGGVINKNKSGINFPSGATWYVSSPDPEFIQLFVSNIYSNLEFGFGMRLESVKRYKHNIDYTKHEHVFSVKSPVLIKQKREDKSNDYYTYENEQESSSRMKNTMYKKMTSYGLNVCLDDFDIRFNTKYENKKIKKITVNSAKHKVSVCPVVVKTSNKDILDFIYDVGVGHSTGSCFGFLL